MPGEPDPTAVQQDLAAARAELEQIRWTLLQTQRLARVGSWERDIRTNEVHWSEEMFRIHGVDPDRVRASKELIDSMVHEEDRHLRAAWLEDMTRHPGTEIEQTMRIYRPDGEVRTVRSRGTLLLEEDGSTRRMIGTVQDITEETRRKEAEAVLGQIVQSASEAIITMDTEGWIRSWNPAAERLYGYSSEETTGEHINMLLPHDVTENERQARNARQRRLLTGVDEKLEYQEPRRRKDGTVIEVHGCSTQLRDHRGKIIGLVTNHRDVTDRRRAEERVAHLADHDALTGLFNRYRFEEELAATSARVEREGYQAAVLELDLDHFIDVNDTHGRDTGDELVASIAEVLRRTVRSGDVLARIGGDSFGVLTAPASAAEATQLADRLLAAVGEHELRVDGQTVGITASAGVVGFGGPAASRSATAAELMADVDRALYESKDQGRNRVTVYSTADRIIGREHSHSRSERLIRDAIKHDRFELYAQPIVRLSTGVMTHVEILVRLRQGDELLPPQEFLPDAERQGLIHLVDYWVISHAFRFAARHSDLTFNINLSGATIDDERLESFIAQELRKSGVDPDRIVFELTETEAVSNVARARELAQRLNGMGCRFALDDFGAGFSTFYYLKHLPAAYLKIDGEFMNDPRSRMDQLVIQSIVRLADDLGKETIAEHVSDAQTLEHVRRLGVDFGQGYHFAKPFPVDALAVTPRLLIPDADASVSPRGERGRYRDPNRDRDRNAQDSQLGARARLRTA